MNRIDLELKLRESDDATFQTVCDYILERKGHRVISYGRCEGEKSTRKGTPDSYIVSDDSKNIIFVEYTTQKTDLKHKIITDLQKCFKKSKNFENYKLTKIIYFINNNNIDSAVLDCSMKLCKEKNVEFCFYSLFGICKMLYKYRSIVKEVFHAELNGDFLWSLDEFVENTKTLAGIDHSFEFIKRNDEKEVLESIKLNLVTILTGKAGVGKSMLALQTLKKINANIYCVRITNENSLDYFFEYIKKNSLTILFLDDVNEVSSFSRFLNSLNEEIIKKIKIICTVREYELNVINSILEKYLFTYHTIKIDRLPDSSIKEMLSKNLGITNADWLQKISSISRGNPRLALMSGKVAIDGNVNNLINSKTIMKKYFEIATNNTTKDLINEYYNILGFIAFLKRVDIRNIHSYKVVLDLFNVSESSFANVVEILKAAELISLYEGCIAQIEDQNLSDYILEKVLIDIKCCSISELIEKLILSKRREINESLNIILNIYSSAESTEYVKSEVLKAWNDLENKDEFNAFINIFYPFNKTKALIYFKKKIETSFDKYNGEANFFEKSISRNTIVEALYNLSKYENNNEALKLLLTCLDYKKIRNDAFSAIKSLSSLRPKSFGKNGIKNNICQSIKEYSNKPWFETVLLCALDEGLKYEFEFTEITEDGQILISHFELRDNYPGIIEYRNKLWKISKLLSDNNKYKLIYSFKNKYPQINFRKIYLNDLKNINLLIKNIGDVDTMGEKIFKVQMLNKLNIMHADRNLLKIHNEELIDDIIFILDLDDLRLPLGEKKNRHIIKIEQFANDSTIKNIKEIMNLCAKINAATNDFAWKINDFYELLIYNLPQSKLKLLLDKKSFKNLDCKLKCIILDANYKTGNRFDAIKLLNNFDKDPDMLEAGLYILNSIKSNDINNWSYSFFNKCFIADLKSTTMYFERRTDTLYRFSSSDKQFVKNVSKLYSIKDKNNKKFRTWIGLLFNKYCFTSDKLISAFSKFKKITVLEKVLLYCAENNMYVYELSDYIYKISKVDKNFINCLVDKLTDLNCHLSYEILSGLWEQDDSFKMADLIFDRFILSSKHILLASFSVEHIFINRDYTNNDSNNDFLTWSLNKMERINGPAEIRLLTDLVSKCNGNMVYTYYLKLIDKKIDLSLFNELLSYPTSCSWSGSQTNLFNSKISKLQKLLSLLPSNLDTLEYRACIEQYINDLKQVSKEVKIREKLSFDDYF